ncbi:MAG: acyltransferase family protein [Microthrixaceae bacterium]
MSPTPRIRALDGLRGFALLGMLAWHAQLSWVKGGFARMTVFFVLSGYLAAKSLLRSLEGGMARGFVRFWGRRARRLLPITVLGVALAVAVTAGRGSAPARASAFGDTVSVLTSWSNWRFAFGERPYGALFESPSAFQHYWSLSVEEQCLIALPLVMLVMAPLVRRVRGRDPGDRGLIVGLSALAAVSCALPLVIPMSVDTVYYGTHVRIGEFLVGVAMAIAWRHVGNGAMSERATRWWSWGGAIGLVSLVAVMLLIDRTASWVYRGGMGLVAVPVVGVIGAILVGGGFVTRVLSLSPLVALGRAAFSIYVIHWPLYQIVESEFVGQGRTRIVTVSFAVSLMAGFAAHHLVERPLLPGSTGVAGRTWARPVVALPVGATAIVFCLVAGASVPPSEPTIDFAQLAKDRDLTRPIDVEQAASALDPGAEQPPVPVFRDTSRVGVAMFGGSTALALALGSDGWSGGGQWAQPTPGYAPLGCGLLDDDDGERAGGDDPGNLLPEGPVPQECRRRRIRWAAAVRRYSLQVPVIVASSADLTTWRFGGDSRWLTIGDPAVDLRIERALVETIDAMLAAGAQKVLVSTPVSPKRDLPRRIRDEKRHRNDLYRAILARVAEVRPVVIVDLERWSAALDDHDYAELIPDGIHPVAPGAERAWAELVGPAIEELWARGEIASPA